MPGDHAGHLRVGSTIAVQYFKYPDTLHWRHDPMVVLGTDEHGIWFGGGVDTFAKKGDVDPPTDDHERGFFIDHPFVGLVVPDGWWTLTFNGPEHVVTHYVDIVTPPDFLVDEVRYIDLDLDIVRRSDGTVYVDDEDEFLEHSTTLAYPPVWIDRARSEAARIFLAIERGDEPFSSACLDWWRRHADH